MITLILYVPSRDYIPLVLAPWQPYLVAGTLTAHHIGDGAWQSWRDWADEAHGAACDVREVRGNGLRVEVGVRR